MEKSILFIGAVPGSGFTDRLRRILLPIGPLTLADDGADYPGDYSLIIINAARVKSLDQSIDQLLKEHPQASIFILTASPTFQRARSACRQGVQYINKSLTDAELLRDFQEALLMS